MALIPDRCPNLAPTPTAAAVTAPGPVTPTPAAAPAAALLQLPIVLLVLTNLANLSEWHNAVAHVNNTNEPA